MKGVDRVPEWYKADNPRVEANSARTNETVE